MTIAVQELGYTPDPEMVERIFAEARPMGQASDRGRKNLGYGHLYYSLVRLLRPAHILAVGSGYGFSVVSLGLGLRDNGSGRLTFVDPSGVRAGLSFGSEVFGGKAGSWDTPEKVRTRFAKFGLEKIVTHYKMFDRQFFEQYSKLNLPRINLSLIDGNHEYSYALYDFQQTLSHLIRPGYVLLHDSNWLVEKVGLFNGVRRLIGELKKAGYPVTMFDPGGGLALVEVR